MSDTGNEHYKGDQAFCQGIFKINFIVQNNGKKEYLYLKTIISKSNHLTATCQGWDGALPNRTDPEELSRGNAPANHE